MRGNCSQQGASGHLQAFNIGPGNDIISSMSGSVDNNQKNDPKSCNRQPFLSEGGCDRGSVDIRQFDDFPFCESFAPTMPEIPPEIVDTPIELPVPPSCACFNIAYAMNMKYSKERSRETWCEYAYVVQ